MMSDEPQGTGPFEPSGDANPAGEPGQPSGSAPAEGPLGGSEPGEKILKKVTGSLKRGTGALKTSTKTRDDYVSELRQTLTKEEETSARKSGGLVRRITGTLRRVTGPLRGHTGELPPLPAVEPAVEPLLPDADIADQFLSKRLSGEAPAGTDEDLRAAPDLLGEPAAETQPREERLGQFLFAVDENKEDEEDVQLFRDQPLMVADTEPTDESASELLGDDSDWVAKIRQEAADLDAIDVPGEAAAAAGDDLISGAADRPKRKSGRLRAWVTGIFSGGARRKPAAEISDELVTGRLERSLGGVPDQAAPHESTSLDDLYVQDPSEPLRGAAALGTETLDEDFFFEPPVDQAAEAEQPAAPLFAPEDFSEDIAGADALFPDALESRLGGLTGETQTAAGAQEFSPEITPEDEALIWGEAAAEETEPEREDLTFSAEDLWAEAGEPEQPEDRRGAGIPVDDVYAAQYLPGELILPDAPDAALQDNLLRQALDQAQAGDETSADSAMTDLRAIALEDFDQSAVDRLAPAPAYSTPTARPGDTFDEAYLEAVGLEARTPAQKRRSALLIVGGLLLVGVAALLVFLLTRGPVYQVGYVVPRPLPSNLPYPTGVVLPGGWQFILHESTFVEGAWKPSGNEWLEGTELRRVVALPWNVQTEAVVQTFKPGDTIWLALSNNDMVDYTVTEVTRISEDDTQIISERRPSLVIFLYKEDSPERWVIFSKP